MVFSTVSKNFTNNVKSKPPLVVFTVCLLGIIVTSFSLAYYVHSHDKLMNVDAKDDWLSLLKYISSLDVCIQNSSGPVLKNLKSQTSFESVSISTSAKISLLASTSPINVQGVISLEEWSSKCPEKIDVPALMIEFSLPKIDQNSTKADNICVKITGPSNFMPKLSQQELCDPIINPNPKKWAKLTAKSSENLQDHFCTNGLSGKLEYDIDYSKNLKFDMYLSQEDRLIINSHLIVTSCFLVFVVILITCYALLRKKTSNNSSSESKQHLMVKGMYL